MPIHFTRLPPDLADAALRAQVITPNERLAREVNAACNQRQIDLGHRAWPKPGAMSLRRYLRKGFDAQAADGELFSSEAELLLWRDTAPNETAHLAEWAAEAWALTRAYRIDCKAPAFGETANGRLFQRWAARFQAKLEARGWITEAQLADVATARSDVLHLLAFERIEPQAAEHFTRIERAGGRIHPHKPIPSPAKDQRRVQLNSQAGEISAAAQWARQVLMADGQARIGVVLPYLTDAYQAIDHAFGVEFADAPNAFDLSGGLPLAQQPVWRAADGLLDYLIQPPEMALQQPALTPFLELPKNLKELLPRTPGWRQEIQPFAAWVASFQAILRRARWGAKAGSGQFQAQQSIGERLGHYRSLTQTTDIDAPDALRTLRDLLSTQVFAPQRQAAPIQVLGVLETTGLTFSHLWVGGLSDSAWPQAPSPNPLIPIKLQQAAGIPRLDHDGEREFAAQRWAHWRNACEFLTASWSEQDAEGPQECSPLIDSLPEASIDQVLENHRPRRHPALAEPPPFDLLEIVPPDRASPYEGDIRAGTALIQNQAKCPFRAWATHRLKLRAESADEPFADPLTRGALVHDALLFLYRDQQRPFSEAAVQSAVEVAVRQHLEATPDRFQTLEKDRVAGILRAWLELEAEHPPSTVVGLEQQVELTLPGAEFRMRMDRIDQDPATGAKLVIDYKTGAVSVNQMLGDRLVEPQLPMYALADDRIEAVLVVQVGDENVRLTGWSNEGIPLGKTPKEGWEVVRRRWREQVQLLIDEFRDGDARVHPHNPGGSQNPPGCSYCHLLSLCRRDAFGTTD